MDPQLGRVVQPWKAAHVDIVRDALLRYGADCMDKVLALVSGRGPGAVGLLLSAQVALYLDSAVGVSSGMPCHARNAVAVVPHICFCCIANPCTDVLHGCCGCTSLVSAVPCLPCPVQPPGR